MEKDQALQAATDAAREMYGTERDAWVQDENFDGSIDVVIDSGSLDMTRVWRIGEEGQVELLSRYVEDE